jgi:hypothetical protein
VPDQAVLTGAGMWAKALEYRALRQSGARRRLAELSDLRRFDLHISPGLLRSDFNNTRNFCKNGDGLLL